MRSATISPHTPRFASITTRPYGDRRVWRGLHYNYFRDYDPAIGRYVESDPIGLLGGNSTFVYVQANPVSTFDELGLRPRDIFPNREAAEADAETYAALIHEYNNSFFWRNVDGYRFVQISQLSECAWTWDMVEPIMGFPPDFGRKPGKLGKFKGTDALRRENKVARDASNAARLSRDQMRELHDRISGQNLTYQQILQLAHDIAAGK